MDVISLDVVHLKGKALTLSKLIMAGVHVIYGRNFITCAIMLVHTFASGWKGFGACFQNVVVEIYSYDALKEQYKRRELHTMGKHLLLVLLLSSGG